MRNGLDDLGVRDALEEYLAGRSYVSARFYKMNGRYEKGTWLGSLGLILRAVMLGWWIENIYAYKKGEILWPGFSLGSFGDIMDITGFLR